MSPTILAWCAAVVVVVPFHGMAATCGAAEHPRLVAGDGGKLEPSGLAWDPDLQMAVGVSDAGPATPGYEVFVFRPDAVDANNQITAQPLLTRQQSRRFQLEDLEGLTRTDEGEYFAIASLSLHTSKPAKDRWTRFQAVRFRLESGPHGPKLVGLRRLSEGRRPDLREWLISSSNRAWPNEAYRKRAKHGGINVEGLASAPQAEDGSTILVVGFRGPLDLVAPSGLAAPVLFLRLVEEESTEVLEARAWKSLNVSLLPGSREQKRRGIRAMERIPGTDRYIVVLGREGGPRDQLRLVLWDPQAQALQYRGKLPDGFVAEGVAVIRRRGDKLEVLLVDDRKCAVLALTVDAWNVAED